MLIIRVTYKFSKKLLVNITVKIMHNVTLDKVLTYPTYYKLN